MNKNSIRLRVRKNTNREQTFKALINHPMETGQRRDRKTGKKVPADYISEVQISIDGKIYLDITLGPAVSSTPFLSFIFTTPIVDKQLMQISWIDNSHLKTAYDCVVKFDENGDFYFRGTDKEIDIPQLVPQPAPVCNNNNQKQT